MRAIIFNTCLCVTAAVITITTLSVGAFQSLSSRKHRRRFHKINHRGNRHHLFSSSFYLSSLSPTSTSLSQATFQRDDITQPSSSSSEDGIILENYYDCSSTTMPGRRNFLQKSLLLSRSAFVSTTAATALAKVSAADEIDGFEVFKTDSGLKYIELEEGTSSKTPRYGQVCVISYTGYLQLPKDSAKKKFASQSGFVLKHGNGKLIAGLDEGLHTMKKGGRRRLVIPPKLGFVNGGLGPIPVAPWQRQTLNSLLTKMVEQRGGNLIYDVQLERFFDDEADQGYYEDNEISPEETAELNRRRLK